MRKEELAEKNCPFFGHGEEMNDLGHCWNKNSEPCIQQCNGLLADDKTPCAFMKTRMKREINTYIEGISVQSDNVGSSDFKLWVPLDGAICAVDMMENRMTKAAIEAFCSSNHSSLCILNRTTNFSCRESCKYVNEFVDSLIETEQQPPQTIRYTDKKKSILSAKCAKCGAVYMANDLAHGVAEWFGDAVKEAIAKGDEMFITDCATLSQCKCDETFNPEQP